MIDGAVEDDSAMARLLFVTHWLIIFSLVPILRPYYNNMNKHCIFGGHLKSYCNRWTKLSEATK
mgnify:CR=1 FL=1